MDTLPIKTRIPVQRCSRNRSRALRAEGTARDSYLEIEDARYPPDRRPPEHWVRAMASGSDVVFGSVNATRRQYETTAAALAQADQSWLQRLITRRVPVEHCSQALTRRSDDVNPIIEFAEGS